MLLHNLLKGKQPTASEAVSCLLEVRQGLGNLHMPEDLAARLRHIEGMNVGVIC